MSEISIKVILVALLAALCSCSEDAVDTTGSIYGNVTNAVTGEVLQGVTITIAPGGTSTVTGSDGKFEYLDLEPRQYKIQAQKNGFVTNTKTVNVIAGKPSSGDITLNPEKMDADISISPGSLNFGTTQTQLSLSITNTGNTRTEWSLDLGQTEWLSASPVSGHLDAAKTQSIVFTVNRDLLAEPETSQISLWAFGNSHSITVSCSPKNAKSEMTVTPTTIDFGENLTEQLLTIRNTGNTALLWSASGLSEKALTISEVEGVIEAGGSQIVKIVLDRNLMAADINTSMIISDGNKQQAVNIKAVKATKSISVSPLSLDFGESETQLQFTVGNTGGLNLNWTATNPSERCISLSEQSGTLAPGRSRNITVTLDRSKMTSDISTSITVSDGENETEVSITATKASATSGSVVTQGLYTYYRFENDFDDSTENAINGYGFNSPAFVKGITPESYAVKLKGVSNNSVIVPNPIIDSRIMTISFWGRNFSDGNVFHMVSSNKNESMFTLTMSEGSLKFVVTRYNNYYTLSERPSFSHTNLCDGQWHHITLVSDFNKTSYATITTTLYVDGQPMDTITEDANPFSENESSQASYGTGIKFILGGELNLGNHTIMGANMEIDNLRVYNTRKLSDNEIREIYNAMQ